MTLTSQDARFVPEKPKSHDGWHAAFKAACGLQDSHGWEDYLVPAVAASEVIELLCKQQDSPFMVLNGITGGTHVWLWLSMEAAAYIETNAPAILAYARRVELRGKPATARGNVLGDVSQLEADLGKAASSAVRNAA